MPLLRLIGLLLVALAISVPYRRLPTNQLDVTHRILAFVESAFRFGIAMGGLALVLGSSPERATIAGAIAGGIFGAAMSVLMTGALGFIYWFRPSAWQFGRAWGEAGFSAIPTPRGFGSARQTQAQNQLVRNLCEEWEQQGPERYSARDFLEERRSEIEAKLTNLR
jgi:hypothetical protein